MFVSKSNKVELTAEQKANRMAYDTCEEHTVAARSLIGVNQHQRRLLALLKIKPWRSYGYLKVAIECETRLAESERLKALKNVGIDTTQSSCNQLVDFAISSDNRYAVHALERASSVKFMADLQPVEQIEHKQSTFV